MNESRQQWELALDRPGSAGAVTFRNSAALAAGIVIATLAVLAWRDIRLAPFPQFATFHAAFVMVVDGIVAFLLFGQFAYRPLHSYAILGAAYLFNALVVVAFLFTFQGALRPDAVVAGGIQSSVWVWHAWHIVFPLLVILSLWAHEHAAGTVQPRQIVPTIGRWIAAAAALALLVAVAVSVFHDRLPVLVTPDRAPLTPAFYAVSGIAVGITAAALALAMWAARRGAILHVWLAVSLTALLGDVVLNLVSSTRYSAGWYFGRAQSMVAAAILLLVFLGRINQLYRQLAGRIDDLFLSNRQLSALVEEKAALVAELQQHREEIRQLAHIDPVTDLPNRRLLMDRLQHALAQGARHGHATAVLFLDLDKFKEVNDRFGHEKGDKLLYEIGARLKRCVRGEDTVSRIGGDEFVIVLPEIESLRGAQTTAEKIIKAVAAPVILAGHPAEVTASVGIAVSRPGSRLDANELLARADAAMYAAKHSGRNRFCLDADAA